MNWWLNIDNIYLSYRQISIEFFYWAIRCHIYLWAHLYHFIRVCFALMLLLFFWADVAFAITAAVAVAASFCIFTSIGNVVLLLVCLCCWRASCCCCCWVCVASGAINCLYGSLGFRAIWDHNGHTQHTHTHTTRRHTCNVENKFSLDVLENLLSVDNSAFSGFLRG